MEIRIYTSSNGSAWHQSCSGNIRLQYNPYKRAYPVRCIFLFFFLTCIIHAPRPTLFIKSHHQYPNPTPAPVTNNGYNFPFISSFFPFAAPATSCAFPLALPASSDAFPEASFEEMPAASLTFCVAFSNLRNLVSSVQ